MIGMDAIVSTLEVQGSRVTRSGDGFTSQCPCHDDHRNSLSVFKSKDGNARVKCHTGCDWKDVLRALGFDPDRKAEDGIVARYPYTDAQGRLLYEVCRLEPKDFRARVPDGDGWKWGLNGHPSVLYRLPDVLTAIKAGKLISIVEGEKDARHA